MEKIYTDPEEILRIIMEVSDNESCEELFDNSEDEDFEDRLIEKDDQTSDSDQSMNEDGEDEASENIEYRFYIGKDEETLWLSHPPAISGKKIETKNTAKVLPGPQRDARNTPTEMDAFFLFITPQMIDNIVAYTNMYIDKKKIDVNYSRIRDCKYTSRTEIQAFIGVLYLIAIKKGNHTKVKELWSTDGSGLIILRANFSYKRFLFLFRSIRLDDITTREARQETDKLAAVREFYSMLVSNCKNNYTPGEFVTIDEMLVPFRGRCSFVQYIPSKPAKYGLKMYALCDSRTFYMFNFEIYCGTQKDGPFFSSNKPTDIVKRLVEPILKSNRNLTTDNWYSSVPLANYLLDNGITFLGTINKNKKEIPPEFLWNKSRPVGSSIFGFQYDISLLSYVEKKNKAVLLLSTMHDTNEIDLETNKPVAILDYNKTKGGVDSVDQQCSTYSTALITKRWPLTILFRGLDISGINSQQIYFLNNPQKICRRREYLINLSYQLMEENLKTRSHMLTLPKDVVIFLAKYRPITLPDENFMRAKKICYLCGTHRNNRTSVVCNMCQRNVCRNHSIHQVTCNNCQGNALYEEEEV